jgi:microsomal dipeptidase-like Zn-dependent dipeptidase
MADIDYFTDFHCHPSMKAFYSSVNFSHKKNLWEFIPENSECKELPKILRKQIREMIKHSQMNLDACKKGRVGLLFASLYPIERGWFDENNLSQIVISKETFAKSAICSSGLNAEFVRKMINDIENNKGVNYFTDLASEYYYLKSEIAKSEQTDNEFFIANCYDDLIKIGFSNGKTSIGLLINIEGGHSLIEFENYKDLKKTPFRKLNKKKFPEYNEYKSIIFNNIEVLKGLKPVFVDIDGYNTEVNFEHCPFYITFAHHFWNLLCGHADSLNIGGDLVLNQNRGKNRKFTKLGKEVICKLLEKSSDKRRILIDIKHLSIKSRKAFFKIFKEQYFSNNDVFPIISSHSAVNGRNSYLSVPRDEMEELFLNAADINLFDEDIRMIYESDGIIGIILNEARLIGFKSRIKIKKNKKKIWKLKKHDPQSTVIQELEAENRSEYLLSLISNIFHIVDVINKKEAWDMICIGSDFDGMIDALDDYVLANEFHDLKADLISFIDKTTDLANINITAARFSHLKFGYLNAKILDKIFHSNSLEFLKKYYHDSFLKFGIKH